MLSITTIYTYDLLSLIRVSRHCRYITVQSTLGPDVPLPSFGHNLNKKRTFGSLIYTIPSILQSHKERNKWIPISLPY